MSRERRGLHRLISSLVVCVFTLSGASAFAQDSGAAKQRTGWDYAGFPLVNFTTDRGVGYGAYLAAFYHGPNGSGSDPYRASIGGQFYQTTGGYAFHKLLLDFPNIADTGVRVDVASGYETWDSAWYFGLGNNTPRLHPDESPERYYTYDLKNIWIVPNLRVPIARDWSLFAGLVLRSAVVNVYEDSLLEVDDPVGTEGGFLSQVQLGLLVDTRDREPSTSRGVFSEVSLRGAHGLTGSDFALWGANMTHRQWLPLLKSDRLVLAIRAGLDLHTGEVPFFHQHILGGSQWVELGGNLMLRGLPNGRYRGNVTAYSNAELRWRVTQFDAMGSEFDVLLVPFFDLGRVWLWDEEDDALHLHGSAGAGLRLIYNDVFVVRFDVASALEEYAAKPKSTTVDRRRAVLGIYAIVNHPF
jgi:hypothetical protein